MSRVDSYEKNGPRGGCWGDILRPLAKNVERSIEKPLHFDKCILYQILEGVGLLSISRAKDLYCIPMHVQYGLITPSGYRDILVQLRPRPRLGVVTVAKYCTSKQRHCNCTVLQKCVLRNSSSEWLISCWKKNLNRVTGLSTTLQHVCTQHVCPHLGLSWYFWSRARVLERFHFEGDEEKTFLKNGVTAQLFFAVRIFWFWSAQTLAVARRSCRMSTSKIQL